MIKVEVTEGFTLKDFGLLKNIVRKKVDKEGELFVGDTFECDENMAKYLTGNNSLGKVVVRVIEILPKEKPIKLQLEDIETAIKEITEEEVQEKEKLAKGGIIEGKAKIAPEIGEVIIPITKPKKKKSSKK